MAGELEREGEHDVIATRSVDAPEDEIVEALTVFAVEHDLEIDRSDTERGMLFRPRRHWTEGATHLFRGRDYLRVLVTPDPGGSEVVITATMNDLHARGDAWKQRERVKGALLAVGLTGAGVLGMSQGFNPGDLIPIGIGGWLGLRSVRNVRGEADSREAIIRDVHNTLERVLDEMEPDS